MSKIQKISAYLFLVFNMVTFLNAEFKLGIDVLQESGYQQLQGKRVGLLTNSAGVNNKGIPTWQLFAENKGINLVALFAPEHGIEGKFAAGEALEGNCIGEIIVYPTYGKNAEPPAEWLSNIDVVVIDLQDVGVRYYTYISSMLYMMAACFKHNIEVMILDRPNPLGGEICGGPCLDGSLRSFLGVIDGLPLIHSLTIAEIANYAKNRNLPLFANDNRWKEEFVCGLSCDAEILKRGKLSIIQMQGWRRDMNWKDTQLPWFPTSPKIQNLDSVFDYALLGFATKVASTPYSSALHFEYIENENRHFARVHLNGAVIQVQPSDFYTIKPAALALNVIAQAKKARTQGLWNNISDELSLYGQKHIGDSELVQKIIDNEEIDEHYFNSKWEKQSIEFRKKVSSFLLY